MTNELQILIQLVKDLQKTTGLDGLLRVIADGCAQLVAAPHVTVRLFEEGSNHLLVAARSGEPLHQNPLAEFQRGQGLTGWVAQHGLCLRTGDAEANPLYAKREDQKTPMGSFLGVPLLSKVASCFGVISAVHPSKDRFSEHDEELLWLVGGICQPHLEVARLARLAKVDPLTGALNRRGMEEDFPEVEARDGSHDGPLSVIMVDIDHFKRINDERGHNVGDQVLRVLGARLAGMLRTGDAVVRYGGEEFLLILPCVEAEAAAVIAERARLRVASTPVHAGQLDVAVTVSLGVAERYPGESRESLIGRADLAMYTAKQAGRDCVSIAPPRTENQDDPADSTG